MQSDTSVTIEPETLFEVIAYDSRVAWIIRADLIDSGFSEVVISSKRRSSELGWPE